MDRAEVLRFNVLQLKKSNENCNCRTDNVILRQRNTNWTAVN
jgi:hypothetical protein